MVRIFLCSVLVFSASCTKKNNPAKSDTYYTCSMHPQIKEKEAGRCPVCGMSLVKIKLENKSDKRKSATSEEPEALEYYCEKFPEVKSKYGGACPVDGTPMVMEKKKAKIDQSESNNPGSGGVVEPEQNNVSEIIASVKLQKQQMDHFRPEFFPVTRMNMVKKIRLLASVLRSEEKESKISAKVDGRVERVFVRSTGSAVSIGDPVLTLYSPKLITAGEEYLLARRSSSQTGESRGMLERSKERLRLWGIKPFQYERWYRTNRVPRQIVIHSDAAGVVRRRNAVVGKYFNEGQNFFELSNLDDVWVEMDVYEHDSSLVSIGQKVELSFDSMPGQKIQGVIDFVNPVLDSKSRTLKIRSTIQNESGKLKPGMSANAVLTMNIPGRPISIPRNAIIDTGKRKIVWVKASEDSFFARAIQTGYESDGYVEVKSGLSESENIVIEGNFLLDAQAQLSGGYEDVTEST